MAGGIVRHMPERKEFGMRGRKPEAAPAEVVRNFSKDRPMYERLDDPEINDLLLRYDEITRQQESGNGVPDDAQAKEDIERGIRRRFEEINAQRR